MDVVMTDKDGKVTVKLSGNLDGMSSDMVMEKILPYINKTVELTIDMEECRYVSSAGLRVLLSLGKRIKINDGNMQIVNLIDEVKEVMEMTGFDSIFNGFA